MNTARVLELATHIEGLGYYLSLTARAPEGEVRFNSDYSLAGMPGGGSDGSLAGSALLLWGLRRSPFAKDLFHFVAREYLGITDDEVFHLFAPYGGFWNRATPQVAARVLRRLASGSSPDEAWREAYEQFACESTEGAQ